MTAWLRVLIAAVALITCATPLLAAETTIQTFSARYTLSRNSITVGEMTRTLTQNPTGRSSFESITRATGIFAWFNGDIITERSEWTMQGNELYPLEYRYSRSGGEKNRSVRLVFDWVKNIVTNVAPGGAWQMALPPTTKDKLSYQIALMSDLQNGRRDLDYFIADGGKLKVYKFVVLGEEQLTTSLGTLRTVKVQRTGDKRSTTVWCAVNMRYLPVYMEQYDEDDGHLTLLAESVTGLGPVR